MKFYPRILGLLSLLVLAGIVYWRSANRPAVVARPDIASAPVSVADDAPPAIAKSAAPSMAPADAGRHTAALATIQAFDHWLDQLRRGETPSATVGQRLARERRVALKELIALDPQAALAHAVPHGLRATLPAALTAELETPVDAFGQFEVVAICDETGRTDRWAVIGNTRYQTYTYGARLATLSKNRLALHGIALDDRLAIADTPYRRLEATEQAAHRASAGAVVVAVGSDLRTFESDTALDEWGWQVAAAEAAPDPNTTEMSAPSTAGATPDGWTIGEKSVLWIRVEFPDDPGSPATDDDIAASTQAIDTFYRDVSNNRCWFRGVTLPGTLKTTMTKAACEASPSSYSQLRSEAAQLARDYDAAHGGSGTYNPDRNDRYIVVAKKVTAYTWTGIAAVGNKGINLNGIVTSCVAAHELGHNHGLRHSHAWWPSGASPIGAGTHIEYGDAYDDMGSGQSGNTMGHFNVVQKNNLGYLGASSITTVTQSGVYRIARHDDRNASGVQALKIATSSTTTSYWIEYRRASPYANFTLMPRLQNGVSVHWDKGPSFTSGPGTYQLDMTPGTSSGMTLPTDLSGSISHVMDDSALGLGENFTDSDAKVVITPVNTGGTAPNEWIDVYVSLGASGGNRPPTAAALTSPNACTARTDLAFSASSSDPDGDTVYYRWDFGDDSIVPATNNVTHRWLKGGTYSVKCTASDGKGGLANTQSLTVTVDDPLLAWTRRSEGLTTSSLYAIVHDGKKFVVVGAYNSLTSADGVNWTRGTQGITNLICRGLIYDGTRFVTVGSLYNTTTKTYAGGFAVSDNGLSWQDVTPAGAQSEMYGIACNAGRYVAVGKGGALFTSTDGQRWTAANSGVTADFVAVAYAGGRFVAVGSSGTVLTSTDGLNWQNCSLPNETSSASSLIYFRNAWYVGSNTYTTVDNSRRVVWSSRDGLVWTRFYADVSADGSLLGMATTANSSLLLGFVSVGSESRIVFTEDQQTWANTLAGTTTSGTLRAAAEGNGLLVVVGLNGQIYTSTGRPLFAAQPVSQTVTAGQCVTLSATASAIGPFTYQWCRNGSALAGATSATLTLASAQTSDAGSYTVTVTNVAGSVTSDAATLTVNPANTAASRITGLSIRIGAGTGDQTLIVGFIVSGTGKSLLVRGVGPTLASYGVTGCLADPQLKLFSGNTQIDANDNWSTAANASQVAATAAQLQDFPLLAASLDAALLSTLDGGVYTAQISGVNNTTGIALVEVYDANPAAASRLTGVSARTQVGTGDNLLIAGFVISGNAQKKVLIRGVGPALAPMGVAGALADPQLVVKSATGTIASNDNWGDAANATQIAAAATQLQDFPLPAGGKDAALLLTLDPGTYTVQVSGVGNTTGVALVEVYEVP